MKDEKNCEIKELTGLTFRQTIATIEFKYHLPPALASHHA